MRYVLLLFLLGPSAAVWANFIERKDVQDYVDELVETHGFARQQLQLWLGSTESNAEIVERISKPAEKVWTWGRYKSHLVGSARIEAGVAFLREHAATLARAEAEYGVDAATIVAILGIETLYGQRMGSFPVLEALLTLGFDYPPRSKFFRKELTEFLLLVRQEGKDPRAIKGSYAGAMGYGQFIPSSYRHYAVDFDGDGVRDIWTNATDAIGSIANYFARHGWQGSAPVAMQVAVSGAAYKAKLNRSLAPNSTVQELVDLGVELDGVNAAQIEVAQKARLYEVQGDVATEHWLTFNNFYVITRYNHSHLYALAVHHIAEGIREAVEAMAAKES